VFLHVAGAPSAAVLRTVATDGHRLVTAAIPLPAGADAMPRYNPPAGPAGVIVPRKTVAVVLAELKRKGAPESVAVDVGADWIRFTIGESVITSKLIDGTFPDYVRVIPQGNDKVAKVNAKAFVAMVTAVMAIASDRGRGVKLYFDRFAGKVTATVNNPDSGSASQSAPCDYDCDIMEIGFQGGYIVDLVGVLASDHVRLEMADPGSPTLFRPGESANDGVDVFGVLMPMRV
jgi:DNA polymerase-3 subunit beta